jgi:NADPH:quinone reductase-like Zn-dependent oxidoreductase
MKAIVQTGYGGTEVLAFRDDAEPPGVRGDQVLIRVQAAGVDRGAWHLMTGVPYLIRLAMGLRRPRRPVLGMDLAGVVVAVGEDVSRFRPGDEVFGTGIGAFAEMAVASEKKLAAKPASLSYEQAAALPISGSTALQAVRDHGGVQPGHRVLVIGASGGVGSYAVQIAKHLGAEVTAVCSAAKAEFVRSLGAGDVIDYRHGTISQGGAGYDVIIDIAGNNPLKRLRRALSDRGTLVIVGGEGGGPWFAGMDRPLRAAAMSPFVRQKLVMMFNRENHSDIAELGRLADSGTITVPVDRTYALPEAAEAIRALEEGRVRGKLVITV